MGRDPRRGTEPEPPWQQGPVGSRMHPVGQQQGRAQLSRRAQGTPHPPYLEGHLHPVVHPLLQHKGTALQHLQVSCGGRQPHQSGTPSSSSLPPQEPFHQHSPVRSMVMGPGACSHIRVSFVTCTLGTLASRDKRQGAGLTQPTQNWHLQYRAAVLCAPRAFPVHAPLQNPTGLQCPQFGASGQQAAQAGLRDISGQPKP